MAQPLSILLHSNVVMDAQEIQTHLKTDAYKQGLKEIRKCGIAE
jgi:hypothetical protein